MAEFSATINGHSIRVIASIWRASEEVVYDGQRVSKKVSYLFLTPHSFTVTEAGESVVYEVNVIASLGLSPGFIIRRNGIIMAHKP